MYLVNSLVTKQIGVLPKLSNDSFDVLTRFKLNKLLLNHIVKYKKLK